MTAAPLRASAADLPPECAGAPKIISINNGVSCRLEPPLSR
ncbi:MAG TPA: hypothetical protein VGP64_02755 [Polyangia bacterium]|jgi:hypothetical protein